MIYADANATYPVDPEHYDQVAALLKDVDGNPSSIHTRGRAAKVALERARTHVAAMFGARAPEIVFTSGATEANNLAVQGVFAKIANMNDTQLQKPLPHIIVTATEHSSVLAPARLMAERGLCELSIAPVTPTGYIDREALMEIVRPETILVCLIHANNETGAINPLRQLAESVQSVAKDAHIHADVVQTFGKYDLTWLPQAPIHSASMSAHKIGGFKGIGALYLKAGTKLSLLAAGGGQERGRRPGTENMPGILSLGLRCASLLGQEAIWTKPMQHLRDALLQRLRQLPGLVIHGEPELGLPNTINFHIDGVAGDDILLNLDLAGVYASSGSACASGANRPSHVLLAMSYSEWVSLNSVRLSFSHKGDLAGVEKILQTLEATIGRVRRIPSH